MKFSVVINTFNRARSLEQTLRGLQRQTFEDFEVIVVNGPSTDGTDGLLERWRPSIRIGRCSDVNLSKSRNIGIDISSGDVVAFIDDDAIPEPDWLEQLAAGYDDERVAGVGGVVFDNTGVQLQYRYAVCDRTGRPDFDIEPPFDDFVVPGADPFLYLQGTNNSYLRRRLEEIDGFDEEIEYYLDETEVCMQLVDRGYLIRSLPGAAVHHRFQPSHLRAERGVWTNVYPQIKNRFYFALSHGRRGRSLFELMSLLMTWVDEVVGGARQAAAGGQLTRAQLAAVLAQADQATTDGTERGLVGRRRGRPIEKVDPSGFRRMPTQHPRVRLRLCFVSEEYPPGPVGGIGRFTSDLAAGLAGLGHEVHVVTRSQDVNRVDLEDDVWVHRVVIQDRRIPGLEASPLRGNLLHHFAMYHAVRRLHERRPLSLVSATIWNAEAFPFTLDPGIPSVTNLVTTLQTVADVLPSWADNPHVASLVRLEDVTLRQSRHFHSGSQAMADEIAKRSPDAGAVTHVIPHGLAATSGDSTAHPNETRTRILFVGRLERRKGVDVLLDAFVELAAEHDVELVLVGRDTPNTELGEGYREWFHRRHGGDPDVARRVRFVGEAEDQERDRWYRSADIFCAPSRYESFGLVILEAMAHGLPIVSCDTGGIPEIIDGQGLLAAPGDVASLRAQLERLVTDDAQRAAMGARAKEVFDERYALERWATRTADAYATIAADEMVGEGGIDPTALADVLIEVAAVTDTVAHSVARDLVEPDAYPVDLASTCANLLVLPDDDAFIGGMYRMVFERDVDAPGLEACRKMLADGAGRLDLIEYAAGSAEGRLVRFDLGWLPRLPRLWGEALADALRPVIDLPAHEFADRLYHLVLHRPPDDQGRRRLFISLARGVPRAAIVSEMARSAEAAAKRVPTEWLESLPVTEASTRFSAATAREALRLTKSAVVGRTRRARHTLRLLPVALQQTLENGERLRELDADAEEGRIELARLASDIDAVSARLAQNQFEATSHLSSWLENLSHKYEAISLDLRERVAPRVGVSDLPEPVIVRPHALAEHLASDRPLRLNLGCGERALAGYVNVDTRALPGVDVVADVRRLPFEASSVDEIFSSHVIEHFRRHHAEAVLLPYWRSLLRPGGALRIVTPNFGAMVARTADGEYTVEELAQVTYGLQEYEGDDHFAGYDPETMERLLVRVGFDDVAIVERERRVGLGIEMEIVARKPEDR